MTRSICALVDSFGFVSIRSFAAESERRMRAVFLAAIVALALAGSAGAQYHYVRPHTDIDGRSYGGHMQANPDGNLYNNLKPPTERQIEREYFPTMHENWGRDYQYTNGGINR